MARTKPFEKHSRKYEEWFEKNRFAYLSELEAVRKHLPKTGKGLEIGSGTGRFAVPLGVELGVEPSSKMREVSRKKGLQAVEGVAEKLPFQKESFDFALMVTTICFVDDLDAAFKEARRVLKPGGCLVVGFVDRESSLGKKYERRKEKSVFYGEATFYSVSQVTSLLEKTGFKKFEFAQTIFKDLEEIKEVEPVKTGFGKGSFVVIKAVK
jgi:ubiquinone/menaquinone biosynthesis C-methylase UbiE